MEIEELRLLINERYPRVEDAPHGRLLYYSLNYHGAGQFVTWRDKVYAVQNGWEWLTYRTITIYCCELEEV